ncbi:hypothetical protein FE784_27820 [Paenibacillus hemerocallicola]|uniref:S-layer protein SbsC C-terminal domain-containing protein n=1 Tax=Paenibacillus hemerocallicola TaxID=1172614 RepID=A0A5C4T3U8_9BACL|nr:carboxypeptidase regulatory-like domain-containing protein [Paenibacillus hemerocallicola]TNJ62967.1 hypothetical protein FE784_27820 [Paenibacillus hemerocallicola]
MIGKEVERGRMPYARKRSKLSGVYRTFLLLLLCVCSMFPGVPRAGAESVPPIAVLYPTEAVIVRPNESVNIQVAALGWEAVELREGAQVVGGSTEGGPNRSIAVVFPTEGIHNLEAVGVTGPVRSVPRQLPPILVKSGAANIADIVPFANRQPADVPDFNGDGNKATSADKRDDLRVALGLVRPLMYPGPAAGYTIQPGMSPGSIRIDYVPQNGGALYYELTESTRNVPAVGSAARGKPYMPGEDIAGANYGYAYLALSEADAQGKVVRFSHVGLHDAMFQSSLRGSVVDWNNSPVFGATLEFRAGTDNTSGSAVAQTATDAMGMFNVDLPAGPYTIKLLAAGYERSSFNVTVSRGENNHEVLKAISELKADQIRIVLTWGAAARDLDSHLLGPDGDGGIFHVYYANTVSTNTYGEIAKLDRDDTNHNGRETVTVTTVNRNVYGTFNYYVHNYSWGEGSLRGSNAKVEVYLGTQSEEGGDVNETLIKSYAVPAGPGQERYWEVMHLIVSPDELLVADINQVRESSPILTKIIGAEPYEGASNRIRLQYLDNTGYIDGVYDQVELDDLQVSAALDGDPYGLSGLQYDKASRVLSFDPIPSAATARQLILTVQAKPDSKRLIPGTATAELIVPAAAGKTEILGLTDLTQIGLGNPFKVGLSLANPTVTGLTYGDLSVTGSVYNTVTGATYANVDLSGITITNDGGWVIFFNLNRESFVYPYNTAMRLTLTVTAKPDSALLTGSATDVTIFSFPLFLGIESEPFAAFALKSPPYAGEALP